MKTYKTEERGGREAEAGSARRGNAVAGRSNWRRERGSERASEGGENEGEAKRELAGYGGTRSSCERQKSF